MAGYLLDTQTILLWRSGSRSMGRRAVRVLGGSGDNLHLSMASIWEICIKRSLGKLELGVTTESFVQTCVAAGIRLLEIHPEHAYGVESLPFHHRDPFDRMLAAQALREDLVVVGSDPVFRRYGVRTIW